LKLENVAESSLIEIEKDIHRLQTITDRFSKIGSEPLLDQKNIIAETKQALDYLQTRVSKQILFTFSAPEVPIYVAINPALHSWTIENLVKNAIDAMRGKGHLDLTITSLENKVKITITDTGKGIPKNQFTKIFEPGFTTKKRGWGLGLSLTKRIVQEYHKGKIKVAHSEIGKGTAIQMSYMTLEKNLD
jgi:signal transduction histidine kinase